MLKVVKPKTNQTRRAIEKRAPKLVETIKKILILHGTKTSSVLNGVLTDMFHLTRAGGNAIRYTKKNGNIQPFESGGETTMEFLSQKTDCSLFAFASHSKKRPNNLILGRMYDHHLYDLVEVGIENFSSMESFGHGKKLAPQVGSKPLFAFIGEGFETKEHLKHLKEVILDIFRGEVVENINLTGLDRVFVCTAVGDNKVRFMHCAIRLKKSGTRVPRTELVEIGPSMDLVHRRHRLPNDDLKKEAMKSANLKAKKKVKNVSGDLLSGKVGRIYVPKQEVGDMALAKMKGLKRERREAAASHSASKIKTPKENAGENRAFSKKQKTG
uniref:Ribosome production factor 2 homolog n=1 Tax=Wollemia nobilis TaxID=56998 RepID=A0A0C9S882_9CONI